MSLALCMEKPSIMILESKPTSRSSKQPHPIQNASFHLPDPLRRHFIFRHHLPRCPAEDAHFSRPPGPPPSFPHRLPHGTGFPQDHPCEDLAQRDSRTVRSQRTSFQDIIRRAHLLATIVLSLRTRLQWTDVIRVCAPPVSQSS